MLLSILQTLNREKTLPQKELGPMFQPTLCCWLNVTTKKQEKKTFQSENDQNFGHYNNLY